MSSMFFLSLGILTFILVLGRLGKMVDLVINKGVDLKDIILLIVYSSPPYLMFTLPMAFLLSAIIALGRLSTENEILALKASGVDLKYLFYPLAMFGAAITIIGLINSTTLLPASSEEFRNTLINIIKKGITFEDKEGIFNDTIPGIVIYIDKVDTKNKSLNGILVSDDRDKNLKQTISADKGLINLDTVSLDLFFVLENGNLHRWEKENDIYRSLNFKDYSFSMNLTTMLPHTTSLRKRPYEMNVNELRKAMITANEHDRYEYLLEIYKKISVPLSTFAFVFLTIPLGVRRKIEGSFSGVLYSLLLFVIYYILMVFTDNAGRALGIPVLITSFTPNVVIAGFGFYLLKNLNSEEHITIAQRFRYLWGRYFEKAK
jgi:lipopolysaccharide export system permease protein